jgi:molybdopterin synthase catalytic subunit
MTTDSVHFALSTEDLDTAALQGLARDPHCGGFASFEGWVRDHQDGREVLRLEYEAYPALCAKQGVRILAQAVEKFGVRKAAAVHRTGPLGIGGVAVWIGVSSAHRRECLQACEWIIDEIKSSLPIWKKEYFADGTHEWVRCDACARGHDHGHDHAHAHGHAQGA